MALHHTQGHHTEWAREPGYEVNMAYRMEWTTSILKNMVWHHYNYGSVQGASAGGYFLSKAHSKFCQVTHWMGLHYFNLRLSSSPFHSRKLGRPLHDSNEFYSCYRPLLCSYCLGTFRESGLVWRAWRRLTLQVVRWETAHVMLNAHSGNVLWNAWLSWRYISQPLTPIMHVGHIIYEGSAWGADYTGSGSG